jgi:hypothetical protein
MKKNSNNQKNINFNKEINEKISNLEKRIPEIIAERNKPRYSIHEDTPGLNYEAITNILEEIGKGIDYGLALENHKDIMNKLSELACYVASTYRYAQEEISEEKAKIESKLEKFFNEKPKGLIGQGYEIFPANDGGKKIYFNGENVLNLGNDASFSNKPANQEIISYLIKEKIDDCIDKGNQYRYRIKFFNIKTKESKEIFEKHAWDREESLRVSCPETLENNIITFVVSSGDTHETKKIKI